MDDVEKKNLLELQTRFNFTGNTLVVVAPSGTKALSAIIDLPMQLDDGKLAVGDIKSVPAGKYAKAALTSLGIWGSVEKHLVQTENVRAALQLVVLGEAKFGIVYASDAKSEPKVQGVFAFPKNSHPQIIYPAAAIAGHASPDVLSFLAYLKTDKAREIMRKRGFAN
jgi:molybdate transport system substrate-binding protein